MCRRRDVLSLRRRHTGPSWSRSLVLVLLFLTVACSPTGFGLKSAQAQDQSVARPLVNLGDALVTGFSGVREPGDFTTPDKTDPKMLLIDPDGASLRGFDLSNPSARGPLGQPHAPEFLSITARDVGQVFGIALDDATDPATGLPAPNIFVTATSAYGLHIVGPDKNGDGTPDRLTAGTKDARWMEGLGLLAR